MRMANIPPAWFPLIVAGTCSLHFYRLPSLTSVFVVSIQLLTLILMATKSDGDAYGFEVDEYGGGCE